MRAKRMDDERDELKLNINLMLDRYRMHIAIIGFLLFWYLSPSCLVVLLPHSAFPSNAIPAYFISAVQINFSLSLSLSHTHTHSIYIQRGKCLPNNSKYWISFEIQVPAPLIRISIMSHCKKLCMSLEYFIGWTIALPERHTILDATRQ